jgi:hypothetical protein
MLMTQSLYPDSEVLPSGRVTLSGFEIRFMSTVGLSGRQEMSIQHFKTERVSSSGNAVTYVEVMPTRFDSQPEH